MDFWRARTSALSLDMAPLIDVVFQLLIFFMLSSSFLHPALQLTLPTAAVQDQPQPQAIVVSVAQDGAVYVNTLRTSLEALPAALQTALSRDSRKIVHLRGDSEMPYKWFVQVMDAARQAGARQMNIVHQEAGTQ